MAREVSVLNMRLAKATTLIERCYALAQGLILNLSLEAQAVVVEVDLPSINLGSSPERRSLLRPIQQLNTDGSHSPAFGVW